MSSLKSVTGKILKLCLAYMFRMKKCLDDKRLDDKRFA